MTRSSRTRYAIVLSEASHKAENFDADDVLFQFMQFLFKNYPETYSFNYPLFRISLCYHRDDHLKQSLIDNLDQQPSNQEIIDLIGKGNLLMIQLDQPEHAIALMFSTNFRLVEMKIKPKVVFYKTLRLEESFNRAVKLGTKFILAGNTQF